VLFPGTWGGAEWGGASVDIETGIMYVNANEIPLLIKMKGIATKNNIAFLGERIYTLNNCTMCHGANRKGTSVFPSLLGLETKYNTSQLSALLQTGRRQMPAFRNLAPGYKTALMEFLLGRQDKKTTLHHDTTNNDYRYIHDGWTVLTDQDGYPGVKPPWGTLNAIDLSKGEIRW